MIIQILADALQFMASAVIKLLHRSVSLIPGTRQRGLVFIYFFRNKLVNIHQIFIRHDTYPFTMQSRSISAAQYLFPDPGNLRLDFFPGLSGLALDAKKAAFPRGL